MIITYPEVKNPQKRYFPDGYPVSEDDFYSFLTRYLYFGGGSRFIQDIQFDADGRIQVILLYKFHPQDIYLS